MRYVSVVLLLFIHLTALAKDKVLNLYTWATDVPDHVVRQFERETGIRVNHMSYDSNEILIAKLRSSREMQFDIIEPTSFYLSVMRKQKLLADLSTQDFPELTNLVKRFQPKGRSFDHIPYFVGATGILVNDRFYDPSKIKGWRDLWHNRYKDALLLLNEPREVFSMALIYLGLNPNSEDPAEIKRAYQALVQLFPNIKLFNSDAQIPLYIDEDITIGMMWNVDASKAHGENPHLKFIYPDDGFIIYNDCFAMTRRAPHPENAKRFLRFLLRPDIAAQIGKHLHYGITNGPGRKLLPKALQDDPMIFPSEAVLSKGTMQGAISEKSIKLYGQLWEKLKLKR